MNDMVITFLNYSGDQDSVVPLLGSRTLIRELAQEMKFKITVPFGAWFHKGQVTRDARRWFPSFFCWHLFGYYITSAMVFVSE